MSFATPAFSDGSRANIHAKRRSWKETKMGDKTRTPAKKEKAKHGPKLVVEAEETDGKMAKDGALLLEGDYWVVRVG